MMAFLFGAAWIASGFCGCQMFMTYLNRKYPMLDPVHWGEPFWWVMATFGPFTLLGTLTRAMFR